MSSSSSGLVFGHRHQRLMLKQKISLMSKGSSPDTPFASKKRLSVEPLFVTPPTAAPFGVSIAIPKGRTVDQGQVGDASRDPT